MAKWLIAPAVLLLILILSYSLGHQKNSSTTPVVTIQLGPISPWIEVWVDDVLTSEWQPADGQVYWMLREMVERESALLLARGSAGHGLESAFGFGLRRLSN